MEESELLAIAANGEDGRHQFKKDVRSPDEMAAEIVAYSNSGGGQIFIGIANDNSISPHDANSVDRLNQMISNAASQSVRPPVNLGTENVGVTGGVVVVVTVQGGLYKPYMDNNGHSWVKNGSDKRKVTSPDELRRMLQSSQFIHGDDQPVPKSSIADIDQEYFRAFFEKRIGHALKDQDLSLEQVMSNMRFVRDDLLTVTGVLLFGTNPESLLPAYCVKAMAYPGTDIGADQYIDSADFTGKVEDQFNKCMGFLQRNLRHTQQGQGVNELGALEVPQIVFEELVTNALIHRDFLVSAPIRVFVFEDRIEIISPGNLPNNLTVANIRSGNSIMRNPTLASHAPSVLPYRGVGSGILRALKEYPDIEFVDDRDGNKFTAVIKRPCI